MSTDRDTARIVRAWLDEGVTQLPDRVLDDVLDRVPGTRQRVRWFPWRLVRMLATASVSLGAAAVLIALAVALGWLPSVEIRIGVPPTPGPTPSPLGNGALDPGTYLVRVTSGLSVEVTVPQGWTAYEGWGLWGPRTEFPPDGMGLGFWQVGNLYADPLEPSLMDPRIGPTVDDLVDGLIAQPGHATSAPVDVTIDGFSGAMVELTIPEDAEFTECFAGGTIYRLWVDISAGYRCLQGPGQIERIWVIDVNGTRLVIDAHHFPGTPAQDLAALDAVIASIRINAAPESPAP